MERYLKPGDVISLVEGRFKIRSLVGRGSSCAVYLADHTDSRGVVTEHLLKEYGPAALSLARDEDGRLIIAPEEQEAYLSGLERFRAGYEKQLSIRRMTELKNVTSNIQTVFEANGTCYIDMTLFAGDVYSKIREESLYDLLRRMKAVVRVLGNYHKAGYLHLDIKPDNIFTIPETCELVMLFDFDSVTEKAEVAKRGAILSRTKNWAAPEQLTPGGRGKICEATDLFAVGEMIFWQIFGRHSTQTERRSFSSYGFDLDSALFRNVSPKVFPGLTELLHRTICTSAGARYQSAEQLAERLDDLIRLADPREPRLVSSSMLPEDFFIGREGELENIHAMLKQDNVLFLSGIGGIGKSELAKNYARQYGADYDTVLFATYNGSWVMLINDDISLHIANFGRFPQEKEPDYCRRKLGKLKELCDERTLLIVDNLNEDTFSDDDQTCWEAVLELGCQLLFTTRIREWDHPVLEVGAFARQEDKERLFTQYCPVADPAQMEAVREIIDFVDGHTLTVELLARQTTAGFATPAEKLEKLKTHGIAKGGKEQVASDKDNRHSRKTPIEHIGAIFDNAALGEKEKYVLANMTLVPPDGIPAKTFADWCQLENFDAVNTLIATGWMDRAGDRIKMHPVVAEVQFVKMQDQEVLVTFLSNFTKYISSEEDCYYEHVFGEATRELVYGLVYSFASCLPQLPRLTEAVCDALDMMGGVLYDYEDHKNCEKVWTLCTQGCKELGNAYKAAGSQGNLALLYIEVGEAKKDDALILQSIEINQSVLASLPEGSDLQPTIYNNLGSAYHALRDYPKAEAMYKKSIEVESQFPERAVHYTLLSCSTNNLGVLCKDQGRFEEAVEYYESAIELLQGQTDDRPDRALFYYNLAVVFSKKENPGHDLDRARRYAEAALDIRERIFHDSHIFLAESRGQLGRILIEYHDQELDRKAEQLFDQAIPPHIAHYGQQHEETQKLLSALALVRERLGLRG